MRIHILGICGTFMSGIALIAKKLGAHVTGSDLNVYPPISTQLADQGIHLCEGYDPAHIPKDVNVVIVGNVIRRGNAAMEYVLNEQIPYTSGPAWLYEHVLQHKWVLAVAGTHGKTTTTSLLTWILDQAGYEPSFLIGGIPENFSVSARLTDSRFFVIEADEYDSAFFDKRSKFLNYRPKTLILNNLEYDHADIFPNLAAIKLQFQYLVRTIPANGQIIHHAADHHLQDVLNQGCWSPKVSFAVDQGEWQAKLLNPDGSRFAILKHNKSVGEVNWSLLGKHNVENALAAISAAHQVGISVSSASKALASFKNVKRRLEIKGIFKNVTIYDDFAHHPTAIATTLAGLRAKIGGARIIAVLEFGSYTMRVGVHKERIQEALKDADMVFCKNTVNEWGLQEIVTKFKQPVAIFENVDELVQNLVRRVTPGDHIVIMSNSGFGGMQTKLLAAMQGG